MVAAKKFSKRAIVTVKTYAVFVLFVIVGIAIGMIVSVFAIPANTVTMVEVVEVPVYESQELPEIEDIHYYDVPLSHSLQRYICEVCADEKVPVSLVLALIETESQFNPEIVSDTNDYGLMQINTINHDWLAEKYRTADLLDPYQNVFCGIKMIGAAIQKYSDYGKALMIYNMGDYGARKAWENGIESTSYVTAVLDRMEKYEKEAAVNVGSADHQ